MNDKEIISEAIETYKKNIVKQKKILSRKLSKIKLESIFDNIQSEYIKSTLDGHEEYYKYIGKRDTNLRFLDKYSDSSYFWEILKHDDEEIQKCCNNNTNDYYDRLNKILADKIFCDVTFKSGEIELNKKKSNKYTIIFELEYINNDGSHCEYKNFYIINNDTNKKKKCFLGESGQHQSYDIDAMLKFISSKCDLEELLPRELLINNKNDIKEDIKKNIDDNFLSKYRKPSRTDVLNFILQKSSKNNKYKIISIYGYGDIELGDFKGRIIEKHINSLLFSICDSLFDFIYKLDKFE